jgi:hypothetical protein
MEQKSQAFCHICVIGREREKDFGFGFPSINVKTVSEL